MSKSETVEVEITDGGKLLLMQSYIHNNFTIESAALFDNATVETMFEDAGKVILNESIIGVFTQSIKDNNYVTKK